MPTPSEPPPSAECSSRNEEWAARPTGLRRSVFGNYRAEERDRGASCDKREDSARHQSPAESRATAEPLQVAIDVAMARSFLYCFLAQAFEDPTAEAWGRLLSRRESLELAVRALASTARTLEEPAGHLCGTLTPEGFNSFLDSYLAAFGHAARGRCPLNEMEYGDFKADPLFQPHRLADLAGFYRAFGLEVAEDADERHDHICLELEFMCVLTAKEAYALEHQLDPEALSLCRDAQRSFLRAHLGQWIPAFTRCLARLAGDTALGAVAELTRTFIDAECALYGVPPGSEELLLRPVDEAAESLCNSCGVSQLPPGALPPRDPTT